MPITIGTVPLFEPVSNLTSTNIPTTIVTQPAPPNYGTIQQLTPSNILTRQDGMSTSFESRDSGKSIIL